MTWLETRMGVRYELPDMLSNHIMMAHKQLDDAGHDDTVVLHNVSNVALCIPKRIIKRAGVGERCFWESDE